MLFFSLFFFCSHFIYYLWVCKLIFDTLFDCLPQKKGKGFGVIIRQRIEKKNT